MLGRIVGNHARRAYELTKVAHWGKKDRGDYPYIGHPVPVAIRFEVDAVLKIARPCCARHDTVEDTPLTMEGIQGAFGTVVRKVVVRLTHWKEWESYSEYV